MVATPGGRANAEASSVEIDEQRKKLVIVMGITSCCIGKVETCPSVGEIVDGDVRGGHIGVWAAGCWDAGHNLGSLHVSVSVDSDKPFDFLDHIAMPVVVVRVTVTAFASVVWAEAWSWGERRCCLCSHLRTQKRLQEKTEAFLERF